MNPEHPFLSTDISITYLKEDIYLAGPGRVWYPNATLAHPVAKMTEPAQPRVFGPHVAPPK